MKMKIWHSTCQLRRIRSQRKGADAAMHQAEASARSANALALQNLLTVKRELQEMINEGDGPTAKDNLPSSLFITDFGS